MHTANIDTSQEKYYLSGLNTKQIEYRRQVNGSNTFKKDRVSALKMFLGQFINPLSFILIAASALAIFMGEISDAAVIMTIVVVNSILGFIQEYRSERAVEKLSELIKKKVLVVRNNQQYFIDVSDLVPDDIVILRGGDVVPADIKIVECNNLFINESQLTGESMPIGKHSNSNDEQSKLLFSGSVVERGYCKGVVYAIGNDTKLGQIAYLSRNTKKQTPYQKSLSEFSISLLRMIAGTIVLMLSGKLISINSANEVADVVLFTIALAMTVVPEALPMITTINLSNGAMNLSKKNVIVKRLSAIEDLGRINILCTDKTGTLTEDHLSVKKIYSDDKALFQRFAYASIENLHVKNNSKYSSFDTAFIEYIPSKIKKQVKDWSQLVSVPFDPTAKRRRMVINDPDQNKTYLVVVGAPDELIKISSDKSYRKYIDSLNKVDESGFRQLALAYKEIDVTNLKDILDDEYDLTFVGFVELYDPLRSTSKSTVDMAQNLGIQVKILTGDSIQTATNVGQRIGLLKDGERVYSGEELELLSKKDFEKVIRDNSVFAKVTPEQKYKIIKNLKKDNIVGYQGDGINDAPSLKLADVSVAVHNATDVAKDSSDIILLDDNLEVVIKGVKYGRSIFVNINKYIKHAMIGNIGNFFSLAIFYVLFAVDLPMLPIQLLIANIIQDMPLMAVFSDSVDDEEIQRPQKASQVKSIMKTSISLGIFTAIYYLVALFIIGTSATPTTQTILFLFFNFTQLLIILSVRNKNSLFSGQKPSRLLIISIVSFIVLSVMMTQISAIASLMGFVALPISTLIYITIGSIFFILLLDITKIVLNKLNLFGKYQKKVSA